MRGTTLTKCARSAFIRLTAILPTALLLLSPQAGFAQQPDDFLFAAPRFSLGVRAGYAISRAESEIHGSQLKTSMKPST